MPPIKSINEPRTSDIGGVTVPKILTQAIPDPPKPTVTLFSNERIVSMIPFRDSLALATERGVYFFDLRQGVFVPVKFQIVEEQNE